MKIKGIELKVQALVCLGLYYGFARHLPVSFGLFGKPSKWIRYQLAKRIFKKCGKGVNIERGASFGSGRDIEIGNNSGIGRNCSIPSNTIYEDEKVKVFLDINPNTNGHSLIIPKKHIVTVDELDEELALHILKVEKEMKKLLQEKLNCEGLTIVQNNELGQEVKHYHVHLIPRYSNDNWNLTYDQNIIKDLEETYNNIIN